MNSDVTLSSCVETHKSITSQAGNRATSLLASKVSLTFKSSWWSSLKEDFNQEDLSTRNSKAKTKDK
jgi:hypothetical protein